MKLLTNCLLALTMVLATSCGTVQSARQKLADMSDLDYTSLQAQVHDAATSAAHQLKDRIGADAQMAIRVMTVQIAQSILSDRIGVDDVVQGVMNAYSAQLVASGVDPTYIEYIKDGAKIIDAAVGQIRLGIDGTITDREKGLILALLDGVILGLQ